MRFLQVTHIALNVPNLREAERYYCELFELDVAWRDSNGAVSMFATWEDIEAEGVRPVVAMLWRDEFRLALEENDSASHTSGRIAHVGLQVSVTDLSRMREVVHSGKLAIVAERENELLSFLDRYGCQWELDTRSYADPTAIGRSVEGRRSHS